MGGALLEYWKKGEEKFTIVDPFLESAPEGVDLVKEKAELDQQRFDVIIVAIKPQMIDDILPDYAPVLAEGGYVISMAAGASIARISKVMGDAPVIRIMPNLPAFVGKATNGLVAGPGVTDDQRNHATTMMERTGTVVEVADEDQLDRVTAVAGSGPRRPGRAGRGRSRASRSACAGHRGLGRARHPAGGWGRCWGRCLDPCRGRSSPDNRAGADMPSRSLAAACRLF